MTGDDAAAFYAAALGAGLVVAIFMVVVTFFYGRAR